MKRQIVVILVLCILTGCSTAQAYRELWPDQDLLRYDGTVVLAGYKGYRILPTSDILLLGQNKLGLADAQGNLITDAVWDDIMPFSEGLAAVKDDGLYGFIDRNGNMTISMQWDAVQSFYQGYAIVGIGLINWDESQEPRPYYSEPSYYHPQEAGADGDEYEEPNPLEYCEKCGVIDLQGNYVVPLGTQDKDSISAAYGRPPQEKINPYEAPVVSSASCDDRSFNEYLMLLSHISLRFEYQNDDYYEKVFESDRSELCAQFGSPCKDVLNWQTGLETLTMSTLRSSCSIRAFFSALPNRSICTGTLSGTSVPQLMPSPRNGYILAYRSSNSFMKLELNRARLRG